jgi:putative secretion ATPase (PEP-CTERM system associated)
MYEDFYNFKEKPFQLVPNPEYLYRSKKHEKALTYLEYGLTENVGYIVLTGEVGSGKTTTVEYILDKLDKDIEIATLVISHMNFEQIIRSMLFRFGIDPKSGDKADLIELLNQFLVKRHRKGKRALLVIDEAQNLSLDVLEELRMLSNLHDNNSPLLQTLLVGQPELLANLRKPGMEQLRQRIAVHFHLTALDRKETDAYIAHRLEIAGGSRDLFTSAAVDMIYELSGGIPRSINLICEGALVYAFADEAPSISQDTIRQITRDHIGIGIEAVSEESNPSSPAHNGDSPLEHHEKSLEANQKMMKDHEERINIRIKALEKKSSELDLEFKNGWRRLLAQERKRSDILLLRYSRLQLKLEQLNKDLLVKRSVPA